MADVTMRRISTGNVHKNVSKYLYIYKRSRIVAVLDVSGVMVGVWVPLISNVR